MACSRPRPFDDDDRPSGSVRSLSQADLQAILTHLDDNPDQLLAIPVPIGRWWRYGYGPASLLRCLRPRRVPASAGRRMGSLDPDPALEVHAGLLSGC
jgi:hypothetical protein